MLVLENLIEEIEIESIDTLYKEILYSDKFEGYVYRGHGKESYSLRPSLLREDFIAKYTYQRELCYEEIRSLILFFRESNNHGMYVPNIPDFYNYYLSNYYKLKDGSQNETYYWLGDDLVELAMLAQHYGVKTRLLDWTQDIKVALYFSCTDKKPMKVIIALFGVLMLNGYKNTKEEPEICQACWLQL